MISLCVRIIGHQLRAIKTVYALAVNVLGDHCQGSFTFSVAVGFCYLTVLGF